MTIVSSFGLQADSKLENQRNLNVAGRKALVIGAARSGIASARFLAQRGATVALNDRKPLNEWSQAALDLKTEGVGLIDGDPPGWLLDQTDLVVVSPGVPTGAIPIRYADFLGAEVARIDSGDERRADWLQPSLPMRRDGAFATGSIVTVNGGAYFS